jgi:hypothetical protein
VKNFPFLLPLVFFAALFCSCGAVDPAKKYPAMVADHDPVSLGTIEAEFDKAFSSAVEKREVEVFFYPRYNAVVLEFRYEFVRYRQFWDAEGRRRFIEALDRYKADYAARSLTDKFSRSRAAYGKVKGRTEWEYFRYSTPGLAYPSMELGYRFRRESPYFMVFQRAAADEYKANSDDQNSTSLQIIMYYTRAQADELVKNFDQDYLMSLLGPPRDPNFAVPAQDDYREQD